MNCKRRRGQAPRNQIELRNLLVEQLSLRNLDFIKEKPSPPFSRRASSTLPLNWYYYHFPVESIHSIRNRKSRRNWRWMRVNSWTYRFHNSIACPYRSHNSISWTSTTIIRSSSGTGSQDYRRINESSLSVNPKDECWLLSLFLLELGNKAESENLLLLFEFVILFFHSLFLNEVKHILRFLLSLNHSHIQFLPRSFASLPLSLFLTSWGGWLSMFIGLLVAPVAANSTVCLVCLSFSKWIREAYLIGTLFADLSFLFVRVPRNGRRSPESSRARSWCR